MSDSQLKKTLLTTRPFKYLVVDELDILIKYCKVLTFSPGEILLHQGKKSDCMYIIIQGNAAVTARILGQESINLRTLEQGNFIGEVNLIENEAGTATVIATVNTECLQLTTEYFAMLFLFFPEIHYKITKAITEEVVIRLKLLHQQIISALKDINMEKKSFIHQPKKKSMSFEIIKPKDACIELNTLKNLLFFKPFTMLEFEELLQYMTLIKTACHSTIIHENMPHSTCYLILRGAIQSSIVENNKIAKLSVLSPMMLFGSITLVDNSPSIISYTACERTVLFSITVENLVRLENNTPLWHKFFYEICKSFVALERAADKLLLRFNSELYNR